MTPYTDKDLAEGWEFKILRSSFATFRNPAKLRAVLDEEKRGGWTLVEKFDDYRIRLKRPAGAKVTESDFADGYDPYRTTTGVSQGGVVAIAVAVGMFAILFLFTIILMVRH